DSANLQGAHLDSANLQGAHLDSANLQGAQYTDKSTTRQTCLLISYEYPCPTTFPPNFDAIAAGMKLIK
ncbi:MAG: pentapeptide repeat-containing protein, partial [Rhizonema sp. PD38]|nr:pentapeptide repeat-containing protein [Rhizonema sp. PD38]